jgi:hypothetical protein
MIPFENYSERCSTNGWTYGTPYYAANRQSWIDIEGPKSKRVQYIDNYLRFINEEMDFDSQIMTDTNPVSYTLTTSHDYWVTLHRTDSNGRYAPYRDIPAGAAFLGNRIAMQDDEIYVVHRAYNLAVKAMNMIKILPEGEHETYARRRGFERMIEKGLPGFDKLEPYEGIIIPSTTD